jgi:glycosyltransferase involved in cell wall biosynthesis
MTREGRSQVVVNGRFLTRRVTGVERHGREILQFLGVRPRVERPALALRGFTGHAWEQVILPRKLNPGSILWSPANTGPLIIREQALTIHDLSPLEHPEWFRSDFALWYRLFLPILVKRVQKVFTPSEYVKRKVMKRFEIDSVIVTPNGVDRSVFHPGAQQNKYDLPDCYILFVGSLEPRKNLKTLLQVWHTIKNDFKDTWLMIAGAGGRVFRPVELSHTIERVRFLGYVDDESLPGLYAGATLLVLPSLDEGFGLPALEAMACGTPVIVSNTGALPETIADAGLIFELGCRSPEGTPGRCEPFDVAQDKLHEESLSASLRQGLGDEALRSSLREKGLARAKLFSWQTTAESIWKTLNEI